MKLTADEAAVIGIAPSVVNKKGTSGDDAKIDTTSSESKRINS